MANTKISQLTSYTGTAADLRWFVMNNSGETETFKYSGYTSPFKYGNGTDNIIGLNDLSTTTAGSDNFIFSNNSTINAGASRSIILGGSGNAFLGSTNNDSAIIACNNVSSYFSRFVAIGCDNMASMENGFAIGTSSSSIAGGIGSGVIGGSSNFLSTSNSEKQYIFATSNSRFSGGFYRDSLICGGFNTDLYLNGDNFIQGKASIFGAFDSYIAKTNTTTTNTKFMYPLILGGQSNRIWADDITTRFNATIISGSGSTLQDVEKTAMINCWGTTITGGTNVVAIGLTGATLLGADNTTYVENLHIFRTPSEQVQTLTSGTTFTMNLDNGAKGQFVLTGASTINITNVRDGASFMIKTQTTAGHAITWTATGGYTFLFDDGGSQPGNTSIDIFNFDVFGSVIYGTRRHNFV